MADPTSPLECCDVLPALSDTTLMGEIASPQHYLEWDHTNLQSLLRNRHLLNQTHLNYLEDVNFRIAAYPQRFARSDWYARQAGLLVLGNWEHSKSYTRCGFLRRPCKQWKFCPACAYQVGVRSWRMFGDAFHRTQWHFLTISYSGGLPLHEPFWCDLGLYWDAGALAVRELVRGGVFSGAIKVEEVSLLSLPGLLVRPHLHFLVTAAEVAESTLRDLRDTVLAHNLELSLQREGISPADWGFPLGIELEPTLNCRLVDSPEGLQRVLKYMAKPIDLVRPYTIAARTANYEAMWEINLAVAEFLAGHTCYVEGRRQRESWGILDPRRRRDFIGVRLDEIAGQP